MSGTRPIFCVECQSEKDCSMITGEIAYPHRRDLYQKRFWQCPKCRNFVGVHNKGMGKSPLGCIPNKQMKGIRMQIHSLLDPIWQNKKMSRTGVYKLVSEKLGYEYHTAEIRTMEEANKVYQIVKEIL